MVPVSQVLDYDPVLFLRKHASDPLDRGKID